MPPISVTLSALGKVRLQFPNSVALRIYVANKPVSYIPPSVSVTLLALGKVRVGFPNSVTPE